MTVFTHTPNVPQVADKDVSDPKLRQVIDGAAVTKSPPQAWYRTMGNNPEVAKAFANYWDMLHRGGTVPHHIKELARIQIAQMIGCEFCARQTSPLAATITEEEKKAARCPIGSIRTPRRALLSITPGLSRSTMVETRKSMKS